MAHQSNCSSNEEANCCCKVPTNPSLCQQLDDMDFERGIWQAAIDDDVDRIRTLITSSRINPDVTDAYGYTALHYASRNGNLKAAQVLIKFGANVNCQTKNNGSTPLHRAALAGQVSMVRLLIESGADVSIMDTDQLTALDRAKKEGKSDVVQLLQETSTRKS